MYSRVSASDVRSVRNGVRVEKESSGSRHSHTVTFNGWCPVAVASESRSGVAAPRAPA
jgi:hypothetical protein